MKNALALIEKNPEAGIISISENDNTHYCRCAPCLELYQQEGSWSGPILNFVNQVADKIHEQYPNFIVETLAYHGSEKPPKTIRPAQNVMIRLAPLGADFGRPFNSNWNADVRDNLLAWQKMAPQLFVWTYATNFHYYMLPHPNWNALDDDLRFFAANNVKGVYIEADNRSKGVGDFVQLRAWLTGKLLWNPQLDEETLRDDFLNGYYGEAGLYLKQYLQQVQSSFDTQNRKLNSFNDDFSFLTPDLMKGAAEQFASAQQAVQDDEVLSARVRREKLSFDLSRLKFYQALQKVALRDGKEPIILPEPQVALEEFVRSFRQFGGGALGLGGSTLERVLPQLQAGLAPDASLPEIAQNKPTWDVIVLPAGALIPSQAKDVAKLVNDAAASSGQAMHLNGSSSTWAASTYLENYSVLLNDSRWRAYAVLRFQLKPNADSNAKVLTIGTHDRTNGKYFSQKSISISDVQETDYQLFDMGAFAPDGNTQLFVATVNHPAVESIFIDRILLIRQ